MDSGERRVGIAIAEPPLYVAVPLATIPATPRAHLLAELHAIASTRAVTALVVGLPLETSGREGASAQAARAFGEELGKALELPVEYQDERMTSNEAARALYAGGGSPKSRKSRRDAVAAALILDAFLRRTGGAV